MDTFINIKNLKYKNIINNINISIEKNSFITISGPNKCGKTTLIKILNKEIKSNGISINNELIKNYTIKEYSNLVGCVIYNNYKYTFNTVEEELKYLLDTTKLKEKEKNNRLEEYIKLFKLTKYKNTNPNKLDKNNQTKLNIAKETILNQKILLLDDITLYMNKKESKEIIDIINNLHNNKDITIIMTTDNLYNTINSDYLYILSEGEVVIEGNPLEVLKKDNILNKLGLELPFMVDLSVKLKDYDLVDDIELDIDRMVNILWK